MQLTRIKGRKDPSEGAPEDRVFFPRFRDDNAFDNHEAQFGKLLHPPVGRALRDAGLLADLLDRRNLSVLFQNRSEAAESIVKRTFEIYHGFVESEAPLGDFDERKKAEKAKKLKKDEEKRRKRGH